MRKKYLKRMKVYPSLCRLGDTCNIHDVSNSTSISVFQNLYDALIEDGYDLVSTNDSEQGCWGCFGYQLVPTGVQQPIIYLLEVFSFVKGGKIVSVVVEHRYDINGNIIDSSYQQFNDMTWMEVRRIINNKQYKLNDENIFIPTENLNFFKTKEDVNNEIQKRNQNLILDDKNDDNAKNS